MTDIPLGQLRSNEIRVKVAACGVCRTDLHVVDGDLPNPKLPLVPGHEIVGYVDEIGESVREVTVGDCVGIPWLAETCGACAFCRQGRENLCDAPRFTGYTTDGGYATHVTADARYVFSLGGGNEAELAPLLCAGLIGWRSLGKTGTATRLGLYGFGASAHIICQVAQLQGREIYAFVRPGDEEGAAFACQLGATWSGGSNEDPPAELDAAIIFAPVGSLVPQALRSVRKGGRVVCAGIHMTDIPAFPYRDLWQEREIVSVANLTRQDGREFFDFVRQNPIATHVTTFPLERANEALSALRNGAFQGAAVLVPTVRGIP
jgi:propanol-preferring alcohol dehydrogenase